MSEREMKRKCICVCERVPVCGCVHMCVGVPVEASHHIKYPRVGVTPDCGPPDWSTES